MEVSKTVSIAETLRADTTSLLKKQRRLGAEYKFKEGAGRPTLGGPPPGPGSGGGGSGSAEPQPGGGGGALATTTTTPAAAAAAAAATTTSAPGGHSGGLTLDAYDPKAVAAREEAALQEQVAGMRGEASRLRHGARRAQARLAALQSELIKMSYEDEVAAERASGVRAVGDERARIDALAAKLTDAEQTARTLAHMHGRAQREKVAQLGAMRAFEDALRVHGHELELSQALLATVYKSREAESLELSRMRVDVKKQLGALDAKLEARRLEVKARQEKARWRLTKIHEERALRAQAEGDMTEAEERAMIERAKNLSHEAAELRASKLKMQGDADAAEAQFHRLRFAAGAPGASAADAPRPRPTDSIADVGGGPSTPMAPTDGASGSGGGGGGAGCDDGIGPDIGDAFVTPDPEPIIARFALLEDEVKGVEEALRDYGGRVLVLRGERDAVAADASKAGGGGGGGGGGSAPPSSADDGDLMGMLDALAARAQAAARQLDVLRGEGDAARALKLGVEQSVALLAERLEAMPAPQPPTATDDGGDGGDDDGDDAFLAAGASESAGAAARRAAAATVAALEPRVHTELSRDFEGAPTAWAAGLHASLFSIVSRLHALMRSLDPAAAARHYAHGARWLEATAARGGAPAPARVLPSPAAGGRGRSGSVQASDAGAFPVGTPLAPAPPAAAAPAPPPTAAASAAAAAAADDEARALQTTIDGIITRHERAVRVRPGSASTLAGGGHGPAKTVSGKAISEAAHAFDKLWKAGSGAAGGSSASGGAEADAASGATAAALSGAGTGTRNDVESGALAAATAAPTAAAAASASATDPFSREASLQRRRLSRVDIQALFAAASSALTGLEDGDEEDDVLAAGAGAGGSAAAPAAAAAAAGKPHGGAGGGGDDGRASPFKPRPRDVQRYLAAAAASAGDDVDDFLLAPKKDAEEVATRERLKRATRVHVRQAALVRPPPAAAGGAGGAPAPST